MNQQQAAQPSKHDSDLTKFIKDAKSESGSFRSLLVGGARNQKVQGRRSDKPGSLRAYAACVQDKNRKAQKGVGAGSARALP